MTSPGTPVGAPTTASRWTFARWLGLRGKLTILLVLVTLLSALSLLLVRQAQERQMVLMVGERREEEERILARVLTLDATTLRTHCADYARWDDMREFTRTRDAEFQRINITESIGAFGVHVAWVMGPDGRPISADPVEGYAALANPPEGLFAAVRRKPILHGFAPTPAGLLEVWSYPIVPSDDFAYAMPASGYYVVGRVWGEAQLEKLGAILGGKVWIGAPGSPGVPPAGAPSDAGLETAVTFHGLDGGPVATLHHRSPFPVATEVRHTMNVSFRLLALGMLAAVLIVGFALSRWVLNPITSVTQAIRDDDPSKLSPVERRSDEVGTLAGVVRGFFEQRSHLVEAREAAEEATRAKSQFLASVSHELRTPMHGILSFARFGMRDALEGDRAELRFSFRQIEECGQGLLAMVNDLLDLAKFEAGRMTMKPAANDLGDVVQQARDEFHSLISESGLHFDYTIPDDLPTVWMDRDRVLQVVRNLLSNAAKFTPRAGRIHLEAARHGDRVRVTVEDSGVGIPAGELETVFDMFVQSSQNQSAHGGTGLGLAICREIVRAHGGSIWAENRAEGGARFVFELPLEPVESPAIARTEAAADAEPGACVPGDEDTDEGRRAA